VTTPDPSFSLGTILEMEGDIQELWKKAFGEATLTKVAPSMTDEKTKSEKDTVK